MFMYSCMLDLYISCMLDSIIYDPYECVIFLSVFLRSFLFRFPIRPFYMKPRITGRIFHCAKRIPSMYKRIRCIVVSWFLFFFTTELSDPCSHIGVNLQSTFRYVVLILIYQFTISELIELIRTRDCIEDLTEGLFLTLTFVALCIKYGNFLAWRDQVLIFLDCFRDETCRPKDSEERMILTRYHRKDIGIMDFSTFHLVSRISRFDSRSQLYVELQFISYLSRYIF